MKDADPIRRELDKELTLREDLLDLSLDILHGLENNLDSDTIIPLINQQAEMFDTISDIEPLFENIESATDPTIYTDKINLIGKTTESLSIINQKIIDLLKQKSDNLEAEIKETKQEQSRLNRVKEYSQDSDSKKNKKINRKA